jgi:two-component system aerobic respiration control sensor histidine kinase ArcB
VALTANALKNKQEYLERGMDDAISKPLSVTAVQDVLAKFTQGEREEVIERAEVVETVPEGGSIYARLLDLEMLESYVSIVGSQPVLDSIQMFEDMMPDYLQVLDSNMVARHQEGIVSEAHKIKGAAGSIGLKHIQSVAQKAQSPDLPAWWENIDDWVEEMKNEYENDIQILKEWLNNNKGK